MTAHLHEMLKDDPKPRTYLTLFILFFFGMFLKKLRGFGVLKEVECLD